MTVAPFHMIDDHGNAGVGAIPKAKLGSCGTCGRHNKVTVDGVCVTGCFDQYVPPPVGRGNLPTAAHLAAAKRSKARRRLLVSKRGRVR